MGSPLPTTAKHLEPLHVPSRSHKAWRSILLAIAGLLAVYCLANGTSFHFRTRWTTARYPDLYEAGIEELQQGMQRGLFTAEDLVRAYIARIDEVNHKGAELHAVQEISPSAIKHAKQSDAERARGFVRGPMHGIPVLLKDNLATRYEDGMNTTAGSYALLGSVVPRDATVTAKLREAGAIFLGKTAQCEWSCARGELPGSWSGRGGIVYNPYYPKGDPCGSSSGSGVAAAIGLAAITIGTETDGSITCPANNNNLAAIKPSLGLTSRKGVIPIMEHQDTVGPLTRNLRDAAIVLSVIAGRDVADNYTLAQPEVVPDYLAELDRKSLQGVRIGVPRKVFMNATITKWHTSVEPTFNAALAKLEELGATIIDPADFVNAYEMLDFFRTQRVIGPTDMKYNLETYFSELAHVPTGVRTVEDLVAFNNAHRELERPPTFESQYYLEGLSGRERNSTYYEQLELVHRMVGVEGMDRTMRDHKLDAMVLPAMGFTTTVPARLGYPIITVPMGFHPEDTEPVANKWGVVDPAPGLPMGLSFLGKAFTEVQLLNFAYAYEQATQFRLKRKAYAAAIPKTQLKDIVGCKWWWIC
ncbi:amidase signature enzyme [Auriculariales sp. MPI-PUGE-AT-0066]|nr:amidase signature enzyme [Auriculariales sp. MPI-PUGE-AT-0066]